MSRPAARGRDASRMAFVAAVLVVVGIGLCVLSRIVGPGEGHSYTSGAVPPESVTLTAGHQYTISIHGGVRAESSQGLDPNALACTVAPAGGVRQPLSLARETTGTKAVNQIANFVSPVSGRVHVDCTGLSGVFVDDADNASPDNAGLFLLLGVIALAIGLPLAVSVMRRAAGLGISD